MKGITQRQKEVLEYIEEHTKAHGLAPTFREIMRALKLSSPGGIYSLVHSLRKKGLLQSTPRKWRGLALEQTRHESVQELIEIPIIGAISKGFKIDLYKQPKQCTFPSSFFTTGSSIYALVIKDLSFTESYLYKEDLLLIKAKQTPEEGQATLISTKNRGTLLGKYFREKNHVRMEPLYKDREGAITLSFFSNEIQILGCVVGQFRSRFVF